MKLLFTLIFVLMGNFALAEETTVSPEQVNAPENITRAEQPGMILGILDFPVYSFYLGAPDINGVAYVPNFTPRVGSIVRWKLFQIGLTVGLPIPKEEVDRRGTSQQASFIFNRYFREWGYDIYFQHYKGFYVAKPWTEIEPNKPSRYPQLPDAEINNAGINVYHVEDTEHYSLAAAFNQMEFQHADGGSWLTTGFYNHLELTRGGSFIPGSDSSSTQTIPNIDSGKFDTLGGGLGYGYLWVWEDQHFFSLQAIAGAGAQLQNIDQSSGEFQQAWSLALKGNLNCALGFNLKDGAYGIKLLADSITSNVRNVQVYSTLLDGMFFYGKRF